MAKRGKITFDTKIGKQYGKPDIERLGIFVEQSYLHGIRYNFPKPSYREGLSMLSGGRKSKNGTQHGYFDSEFKRVFEGEARGRTGKFKTLKADAKLVSTLPFLVGATTKKHSTPGDNYGTFTTHMDAFGNVRKKKPPYKSAGANFLTRNIKEGGPGYADICLNKYPEHSTDRYAPKMKPKEYGRVLNGPMISSHYTSNYFEKNPFAQFGPDGALYVVRDYDKFKSLSPGYWNPTGPAKWKGGCQAGCFDKFPVYMPSRYKLSIDANKPTGDGKFAGDRPFMPHSRGLKTMFTNSVLNQYVDLNVNNRSYKTIEPNYIKHLID